MAFLYISIARIYRSRDRYQKAENRRINTLKLYNKEAQWGISAKLKGQSPAVAGGGGEWEDKSQNTGKQEDTILDISASSFFRWKRKISK